VTAWAEQDNSDSTRAEPLELCDKSVARTVPSQYNPTRREMSNKEIQPSSLLECDFAMSTDASLDLGACPVSPVRASESTNVMFPQRASASLQASGPSPRTQAL
jgi:hypothetical protein